MFNLKCELMKKLIFLQIIIIGALVSCSYAGKNPDKEVIKAYELRMSGKVDEAKAVLEAILAKDSTNAMAHYEMARLKHYMLTGGGEVKIDDIYTSANKAVIYEPDNVTYSYYKALASFLNAFMAMQTGQGDVKSIIAQTCADFEKVLKLKPDYYEASLYLVEIYGMLPQDMGGDSAKAAAYADKLGKMDSYFGAKAKAAFAPENADMVKFWKDLLISDAKNPELLMEVGRAYLYADDPINAENYFNEAIKADPSKNILILDLARFHMYKVMENKDLVGTELPIAKTYLEKYLNSSPEPVVPLKAYAMGALMRCEMFLGNQAEAEKLMEEAKSLDPYFSRASGVPTLLLFDPPDQISHHFFSFFRPF
jgi:tetratricopeptide (TPR) repeat protein